MNFGVRRFLGGGTSTTPPPPSVTPPPQSQPSVPPLSIGGGKQIPRQPPPSESPSQSQPNSPRDPPTSSTAALFLRKDKQKPLPTPGSPTDDAGGTSNRSGRSGSNASVSNNSPVRTQNAYSSPGRGPWSPLAGPSSPRSPVTRKSVASTVTSTSEWKRTSGLLNTKDELLMSLLSSEAVVDSREFEILSSEEVDDLKKEQQVLASRLGAMSKKLSLETKIRDAALSLAKVNAAHKKVSKQSEEQLEAASRRVEAAQKEFWRVSERSNEVQRKLLEHRAAVLGFTVRSMEKKLSPSTNGTNTDTDGSGYSTPNRSMQMSPTPSSVTSVSVSSKSRFDGAHLFAGHADALVPVMLQRPGDVSVLEAKLKSATDALNAANQKQADLARELSHLQLEKTEVETSMGMELQSAEETISALEKELPRLESQDAQLQDLLQERRNWERDKADKDKQIEMLERRLEVLEEQSGEATGMEEMLMEARKSSQLELQRKDEEIREIKAQWERHKAAGSEVEEATSALQGIVQAHDIFAAGSSLQALVLSIGSHLGGVSAKLDANTRAQAEWDATKQKLEADVRSSFEKRETLLRDVEIARQEREEIRRDLRVMEERLREQTGLSPSATIANLPSITGVVSDGEVTSILRPLWAVLPSPEARAAKLGASARNFRPGGSPASSPKSPKMQLSSLSEMDVRSLKTLYDTRTQAPASPNISAFSIDAFAQRVQALISDDRALIERLIRFAQAHDLLKKNAERAQKLAQDANNALETYQKQVRTLEERNMTLTAQQAALQDEVQRLQDVVERIRAEKLEIESLAAEQAETCRQLTDANNTLSAKTLTLAEEAASAPEMIKRQLEAQLAECKASLNLAQEEVDAMRSSEQSQRIALLDELNSMQTENSNLRAQLRAVKK
ncbi:hypothetical protein PLICRDRAFT_48232 [Plicaturopsis crispa FD-325 SS-3]|nr:hypothetical protein PLICRDRAFT_48232 [Plicaturopsis crispa FD-325 SS-3]